MTTATQTTMLDKFRKVYADAVIPSSLDQAEWKAAMEVAYDERELRWMGEDRVSLADAAEMYACIENGYNEFQPNMLSDLNEAFADSDIEVTPARELSVTVYLHIPTELCKQVRIFVEQNFHADEVNWVKADTLQIWWD